MVDRERARRDPRRTSDHRRPSGPRGAATRADARFTARRRVASSVQRASRAGAMALSSVSGSCAPDTRRAAAKMKNGTPADAELARAPIRPRRPRLRRVRFEQLAGGVASKPALARDAARARRDRRRSALRGSTRGTDPRPAHRRRAASCACAQAISRCASSVLGWRSMRRTSNANPDRLAGGARRARRSARALRRPPNFASRYARRSMPAAAGRD